MPDINRLNPSEEQPLDSWKEIAAYLDRDERTARRWEKTEGLPVHRHQHLKRQSVFAYRSEIDAWRQARSPKGEETSSVRQPLWRHRLVPATTAVLGLHIGGTKPDGLQQAFFMPLSGVFDRLGLRLVTTV